MSLTVPSGGLSALASSSAGDPIDVLVAAWLAGYKSPATREVYATSVRQWRTFCAEHGVHPLAALRAHVELWQRTLEAAGRKPRTVYARLASVGSWYQYLVEEGVLDRSPMIGVHRPVIERRSPSAWLTRAQLADLLAAGTALGPHPSALLHVLALNGLRIGEACSLDVASLGWDGYYPTLTFTRKGGKEGRAVLARPTESAVRAAIGDRASGPLLLNQTGARMNRACAQRIIDRSLLEVRGFHGRITPHSLRHSWGTACVDAHVPTDQVQHDGGWADPRMVGYYSHGKDAPARAATHAVAAYVYGAA